MICELSPDNDEGVGELSIFFFFFFNNDKSLYPAAIYLVAFFK